MKAKLFIQDMFEKENIEKEFNEQSKKGYNPIEIGYSIRFENNKKRYFYRMDILKGNKLRAQRELLDLYDRYGYSYCGKKGRMIFFKGTNKNYPKEREIQIQEYLKKYWIRQNVFLLFEIFLLILCISFLLNKDIQFVLTNGLIVLSLIPFTLISSLFCFTLKKYIHGIQYKAKQPIKKSILTNLAVILLIVSLLCVPVGCILDFVSRKTMPTDSNMLTLSFFDKESTQDSMSCANSLIVHTQSVLDQNKDDILFSCVYTINKEVDSYYEYFIQSHLTQENTPIQDGYIYSIEKENDAMILKIDDSIIEISATFDLSAYTEQIHSFYMTHESEY
ncbi:DUF2812 domain-containing protein [Floccifex sp.]|uniref:DUF2812 domain-containing protein n=1 Tax=Floccifex sp. TaxID=2815810 RepID=UPI003F08CDD4